MNLPAGLHEIDPAAEAERLAAQRERGRLDHVVVDEFHRAAAEDGHPVYARITVAVSEVHPLPAGLLASLQAALRDAWEHAGA